jgi:hypothetical protein
MKLRGGFLVVAPRNERAYLPRQLSGFPLELVFPFRKSLGTKLQPLGNNCAPVRDEIFKPQRGPSISRSYLQKLHRPDPVASCKWQMYLSDGSSSSFLACPKVAHSDERVQRGYQCPTQVRFQRRRSFNPGQAYLGPAARSGIQGQRTRCSDRHGSCC